MEEHLYLGRDDIWNDSPYFDIPVAVFEAGVLPYPEELQGRKKARGAWSLSEEGYITISEQPPVSAPGFEWIDHQSTSVNTADGSRNIRVPKPFFQGGVSDVPEDVRLDHGDCVHLVTSRSMLEGDVRLCYVLSDEQLFRDFTEPSIWEHSRRNTARIVQAGLEEDLLGEEEHEVSAAGSDQGGPSLDAFAGFEDIRSNCEVLDNVVRESLRDLENMGRSRRVELIYGDWLDMKLQDRHGISLDELLEWLDRDSVSEKYLGFRSEEPDLVVQVRDSMDGLSFHTGDSRLDISDPELLWDCHCLEPQGYFTPEDRPQDADQYECPIHGDELGGEVTSKFRGGLVEIRYKGVDVFWFESRNFWPPSVDSVLMCSNLREAGVFEDYVGSVLDMGCGTGFLGIQIAKHNPNVDEIYLADWLLAPVVMSKVNWELNRQDKSHVSCNPRLGLGFEWFREEEELDDAVDALVCNPPYLPGLQDFPEIKLGHTIAGTELLETVIQEGGTVADRVYIHFSDIAEEEAAMAADEADVELTQVGEKSEVPFRVQPALEHPEYVDELVDRGLKTRDTGRYKYWHEIGTYRVENR